MFSINKSNLGKDSMLPKIIPPLDRSFSPASLYNAAFTEAARQSGAAVPLVFSLERESGYVSVFRTVIFPENTGHDEENLFYAERLVKTLLWIYGGWRITIGGPSSIGGYIKSLYKDGGMRGFDANFMSRVYEKPFTVETTDYDKIPCPVEGAKPAGRHFEGCRIGFDAGGSDRKVSAVIDGKAVYSEEVIWHPKLQSDPKYHHEEILAAMKSAAARMPHVDAIGVSSAGIYINNRIMAASLFLKVPEKVFDREVKDMFLEVAKEMGNVPLQVANDGDVTALAGAMDLDDTEVLGIAMGTSQAAGYVDRNGYITGWLNELAFVPIDYCTNGPIDEWSGDTGCGVKYFSQDAVIRLAPTAGIGLDESLSPAEKLKAIQDLLRAGDGRVKPIYETIGVYLGYAIGCYSSYYDIKHVLILGRVTSGEGGAIILNKAQEVLSVEFPQLAGKISLHLPDESNRRVGQSIAAASLPEIS